MSTNNNEYSSTVHALARLSYAQGLMAHRRVLILGNNLGLATFAIECRARWVTAVAQDDTASWPAEKSEGALERVVMPYDDIRFRDGAYDLAVVPDLTEISAKSLSDLTPVLSELRRVVGPRGHCLVATPNPACDTGLGTSKKPIGPDYYEVYDLLAAVFPNVQMIGQSPFVGYAVADLSFEDPDLPITFDGGLLGEEAEEIEWFLSVCGEEAVDINPYSVIQIPLAEVDISGGSSAELDAANQNLDQLRIERDRIAADHRTVENALALETAELKRLSEEGSQVDELQAELDRAKLELSNRGVRIGSLEKELEQELQQSEAARARGVKLAKELDNERKAAQKKQLEEEFAKRTGDIELQTKLKEAGQQLRQAEERARSAEAAHDGMVDQMRADAQEIDTLRDRFEKAVEQYKQSKEREKSTHEELSSAVADFKNVEQRAEDAESKSAELEGRIKDFEGKEVVEAKELEEFRNENERLEQNLLRTGERVIQAEAELARREAIVRDLVVAISKVEPVTDGLDEKISGLKSELEERDTKIAGFLEQIEKAEIEVAALWGAKAGQHRARVEAELKLATLEDRIERMGREMASLGAQRDTELEQLADIADAKTASVDMLKQELARAVGALQKTQQENRSLIEKQNAIEVSIRAGESERDKQIARLEAELQAARWQIQELEARKSDIEANLAKAMIDKSEKPEQGVQNTEEIDTKYRILKEEAAAANSRVAEMEQNIRQQERSWRLMEEESDRRKTKVSELTLSLDDNQKRQRELEDQISKDAEERDRIETELGSLRSRLEAANAAMDREKRDAEKFRKLSENAESKLVAMSRELQGAGANIAEFNRSAEDLEVRLRHEFAAELAEATRDSIRASELERKVTEGEERFLDQLGQNESLLAAIQVLRDEMEQEADLTRLAGADAARVAGEAADLRGKISLKESELKEREEENEAAQRALHALRDDVASLTDKFGRVREELVAEQNKGAGLLEEIARRGVEAEGAASSNAKIESLMTEMESKDAKMAALQDRAKTYEIEIQELRQQAQTGKTETDRIRADIDRLQLDNSRLEGELKATRDGLASASSDAERFKQSAEATSIDLANLKGQLQTSEKDRQTLEDLRLKLDEANKALVQAEEAVAKQGDAVSQDEVESLKKVALARETEIETLTEKTREQASLLESLTSQLEERETRATGLDRRVKELKTQIGEHESDILAWEMELKFRNSRISQLEQENERLRTGAEGNES